MTQRRRFRALMAAPGLTLMPGAYDALSARIIEREGFEAVLGGGYAAIGSLLGEADGGQSNVRDYADHYGRMCDAVEIPVFVDADTGFGWVHNVAKMVRMFERAGVAGLFFSDQAFPNRCGYMPGKQVVPVEEMLARLAAALDARTDPELFIAARTDVTQLEGLDAAMDRCRMFMEAGADMAMPHGADTAADIGRVLASVPGPHMAILSHAAGGWAVTPDELAALGVPMVCFPSAALFAAAGGVTRAMRALKTDGGFDAVADALCPLDDYYDLVGLQGYVDAERRYLDTAARLAAKKRPAAE